MAIVQKHRAEDDSLYNFVKAYIFFDIRRREYLDLLTGFWKGSIIGKATNK